MRIKPSKTIGVNYLERWHIIPRNPIFNCYLHKYSGSDDDRALHDHPWASVSFLLSGRISEFYETHFWTCRGKKITYETLRKIPRGWPVFRSAKFKHRIILTDGPAWTLFLTGPRFRKDWYFWCAKGPVHYSKMTTPDGKQIGGCE